MNDAAVRRVEGVGFVLAVLGMAVAALSAGVGATHHSDVLGLVTRGPLALPMLGAFGSVGLLAATRRRRGRAFAALWAVGNAASILIVRTRAEPSWVAGLDMLLIGTLAIALGACLTLVPQRRHVVTPSAGATGDG